jgi:hypothetical protein
MRTLTVLLVLILSSATPAFLAAAPNGLTDSPEQARVYDKSGRYQGKAVSDGRGQTKTYDKSGRYQGKAVQTGKTVKIYDKSGRYIGRATTR